ncbi:MAG: DUF1223 domain-containing protein, partial [Mesorhizobium sp.]|nr:DUF1223 domain-containing protein [Mesorhizobium sp.]
WGDTLATPENTARQNDYRRSFGNRSVYTPQAVINGRIDVNGAKHDAVVDALKTLGRTGKGLEVDVSITRNGDSIVIAAGKAAGGISDAHVVLVFFSTIQSVDITKGENSGRRVVYWNPVTGIQAVGMWHGAAARFELPASEIARKGKGGGMAVLVQEVASDGAPGPIVGAAIMNNEAI